ncbi:MAG: hypothetical protein EBV42_01150 [Actinobacteria bacterium]|nr:hypothetical protein [Actinomycetota bacterium]
MVQDDGVPAPLRFRKLLVVLVRRLCADQNDLVASVLHDLNEQLVHVEAGDDHNDVGPPAVALALDVPFVGVNHLEAHLYAALLDAPDAEFPMLFVLVSGGHTMFVAMNDPHDYRVVGQTIDDAAAADCVTFAPPPT